MLIPKYSNEEMCDAFENYIDGVWGNVNIAGVEMPTSEAIRRMGDLYDELLEQYLEANVNKFYESIDPTRPIGGRS